MNKHIILLVGLPGSGKSTTCELHSEYIRISQDEQGKDGHFKLFKEIISQGKNVIIDRCNFNTSQRERYLKPAKTLGYKTTIIWLKVTAEECKNRIRNRDIHPNLNKDNANIDKVVDMFHNMFEDPQDSEADEIIIL